ncbi:MAG: M15 family metallopeptidase [Oscillospiraceae bacterium]|jgi:D-alanyl-D-alanine carboxypeptidase|nr:M15 family metallopeptidase [Oscillospiraceae bacterium]
MKKTKGTVAALLVILIAGIGLYFAWSKGALPQNVAPMTTAPSLPKELWETQKTTGGQTSRATTTTASGQSTKETAAETQTSQAGALKYDFDYPNIHPALAVFNQHEWHLMLVSRRFALPADYAPETAVCVPGVYKEELKMDARVAPIYYEMYKAAKKDGAELIPYSGYRSITRQKGNFERKIAYYQTQGNSYAQAVNLAAMVILPPGCSEHEAGLAMDITRPGVWGAVESFEDSKEFAWLQKNAANYGFILRYPKDKTKITQVSYEPWHWRYVGKEAALLMQKSGECLEEYLESRAKSTG